MLKKLGCLKDQVNIRGKCYDVKGRASYIDVVKASKCYEAIASMKNLYNSDKDLNSHESKRVAESVIAACLNDPKKQISNETPLHFKGMDVVGKHTRRYPHKGVLPSGHRGDLIKIRNGHGTLTFFPSS